MQLLRFLSVSAWEPSCHVLQGRCLEEAPNFHGLDHCPQLIQEANTTAAFFPLHLNLSVRSTLMESQATQDWPQLIINQPPRPSLSTGFQTGMQPFSEWLPDTAARNVMSQQGCRAQQWGCNWTITSEVWDILQGTDKQLGGLNGPHCTWLMKCWQISVSREHSWLELVLLFEMRWSHILFSLCLPACSHMCYEFDGDLFLFTRMSQRGPKSPPQTLVKVLKSPGGTRLFLHS